MTVEADPTKTPAKTDPEPKGNPEPGASGTTKKDDAKGDEHKQMSHEAFNARIREAEEAGQKKALKAIGVENVDIAKTAIAKAKQLEQEKLSESEKQAARIKELEPGAARAKTLEESLSKHAAARLKLQPEKVQKYIKAVAGDDAERILANLDALEENALLANPPADAAKTGEKETKTEDKKPANSRAGTASPPTPTAPGAEKHPRDMTLPEFQAFERKHIASLQK